LAGVEYILGEQQFVVFFLHPLTSERTVRERDEEGDVLENEPVNAGLYQAVDTELLNLNSDLFSILYLSLLILSTRFLNPHY
jgi:hypothetical protein